MLFCIATHPLCSRADDTDEVTEAFARVADADSISPQRIEDDFRHLATVHGDRGIATLIDIMASDQPVVSVIAFDVITSMGHAAFGPLLTAIRQQSRSTSLKPGSARCDRLALAAYELAKKRALWETNLEWQQAYVQSLIGLREFLQTHGTVDGNRRSFDVIDVTLKRFERIAAFEQNGDPSPITVDQSSVVDTLLDQISSQEGENQKRAFRQLIAMGESIVPILAQRLSDESYRQSAILKVLSNLGPRAKEARMAIVMIALHDSVLQNRINAISALIRIGFQDQWLLAQIEQSSRITEVLGDDLMLMEAIRQSELSPDQRQRLQSIGNEASRLVYSPFLSQSTLAWSNVVATGDEQDLRAAIYSLSRSKGVGGWETIAALRREACSTDARLDLRIAALNALQRLASNNRREPSERSSAIKDWTASLAIASLEACLDDPSDQIRFAAAARILSCARPVQIKKDDLGLDAHPEWSPPVIHKRFVPAFEKAERLLVTAVAKYQHSPSDENADAARAALLSIRDASGPATLGISIRQALGDQILAIVLRAGQPAKPITIAQSSQTVDQLAVSLLYRFSTRWAPKVWQHVPSPSLSRDLIAYLQSQPDLSEPPQVLFQILAEHPVRLSSAPSNDFLGRLHEHGFDYPGPIVLRRELIYGDVWFDQPTRRMIVRHLLETASDDTLTTMLDDAPSAYDDYWDGEATKRLSLEVLDQALSSENRDIRFRGYDKFSHYLAYHWDLRSLKSTMQRRRDFVSTLPKSPLIDEELLRLGQLMDHDLRKTDPDDIIAYADSVGSLAERIYARTHVDMVSMQDDPKTQKEFIREFELPINDEDPGQVLAALADELELHLAVLRRAVDGGVGKANTHSPRPSFPTLRSHPFWTDDETAFVGLSICISRCVSLVEVESLQNLGADESWRAYDVLQRCHESLLVFPDEDLAFMGGMWIQPAANQLKAKIELMDAGIRSTVDSRIAHAMSQLWAIEYARPIVLLLITACVGLLSASIVWLVRPVWIMDLGLALEDWSVKYHGFSIAPKEVLCIGLFQRTRRVSDAWVRRHATAARKAFSNHPTVSDRAIFVPAPIRIGHQLLASPKVDDFRSAMTLPIATLLIVGEGGSGKTSLACQLGRQAIAPRSQDRLMRHLMLPILIEEEFKQDVRLLQSQISNVEIDAQTAKEILKDENDRLVDAVSGKLMNLIGSEKDVPRSLVVQLLRQRRILLIVDHFSELSDASRSVISPDRAGFPAKAMVITSRQNERQLEGNLSLIRPLRVGRKRLIGFVDAYLDLTGAREWFDADNGEDELDLAQRLKSVVAQREVTILIARMFLDAEIARLKGHVSVRQPASVPELMLHYVSWLNRSADDNPVPDPELLNAAKRVGWHCLKNTLRPSNVSLVEIQHDPNLDFAQVQRLLHLGVLVHSNLLQDEIRFSLDPLSEYLAALHFIDSFQGAEKKWDTLLKCVDQLAQHDTTIEGFTQAAYDCACHSRRQVSARTLARLKERALGRQCRDQTIHESKAA